MNKRTSPLTSVIMIPVACLVGLPLYYILVNTFKTQQEMATAPLALPQQLFFDNYQYVFENVTLLRSFSNTLFLTVVSILVMLFIGSTAAYGMILRASRFNRWFGLVLMLGFIIPFQATLIPLYRFLVDIGLIDTLTGLVLLYSAGSIFCYFLIQGYMKTLPFEIIEAAKVDGASVFQIYWRIVLPLIRPILVTVGVFQTMWIWNDFITPNVFLSSPEKKTLVLEVYRAVGEFTTNWPSFMTLSVIVLIPMVIFFVLTQRHIVSGLLAGGVKG
ncbi:MAG: carbohydrate ABC transporter permease [Actinomycetales bacterium]|nr:carbohydrate ABC transporter permease [Actinomycetales bacterium]